MYKTGDFEKPKQNQELTRIEEALNGQFDIHQLRELNVEPTKPKDGMIARSDGFNWNPGGGKGLYLREDSQWKKICTDCGASSGGGGGYTDVSILDRFGMYIGSDDKLKAYIGEGGSAETVISSDSALTNGVGYFVFITRTSGVLKMYIDTIEQSETAAATHDLGSTTPTFTVGQSFNSDEPFTGGIDDCGVLDEALTTDELAYLFTEGA